MNFEIDLETDLDVFLDEKTLVFGPTGLTINGNFDNTFETVLDGVETAGPAVTVKDSDIAGIVHGDIFTRIKTGIVYKTIGIHPDGTGLTFVILSQD
jgi:hypothetical protein